MGNYPRRKQYEKITYNIRQSIPNSSIGHWISRLFCVIFANNAEIRLDSKRFIGMLEQCGRTNIVLYLFDNKHDTLVFVPDDNRHHFYNTTCFYKRVD